MYPEPPEYNSQIPRGQGPQGEDGLYEEAEDTRNSVFPPIFFACSPPLPSQQFYGNNRSAEQRSGGVNMVGQAVTADSALIF